jgi:FkbM family methyltransferase
MKLEERTITYAQNREDVILAAFFPGEEHGFYVDIGAHHPSNESVTKYFYNIGWRGINVEPNQKLCKLLDRERSSDININMGIADKAGVLVFREYPENDGLSTFSETRKKYHSKKGTSFTKNFKDYPVRVTTLKKLLKDQGVKSIQFLKIDVEGLEYEVLSGNDWNKYKPDIVCIEANHVLKDWRPILKDAGYFLVFFDGLNEYYAYEQKRADKLSYVENALGENVVYYKDQANYVARKNEIRQLKQQIESHKLREKGLEWEILHRDQLLSDTVRFRVAVKNLFKAVDKIIQLQLSRLNHPRRKHASRNVEIKENLGALSTQELIKLASIYDLRNYYTTKKGSDKYQGASLYILLDRTYKLVKRATKFFLKSVFRLLRKVRKAV